MAEFDNLDVLLGRSRPSIRDYNPFPVIQPVDLVQPILPRDTRSGRPNLTIVDRSAQYRITERDITDRDSLEDHLDMLYERSLLAAADAAAQASMWPCW